VLGKNEMPPLLHNIPATVDRAQGQAR
jgi:hypothetical protein